MKEMKYLYFSELDFWLQRIYRDMIFAFIQPLRREYPCFEAWYHNMFEGYCLKTDREIILALWQNRIVGVSILKRSLEEKKLCTLKVAEAFQNVGIGRALMERSFQYLDTDHPFFTVPQNRMMQFEKLFQYYGFLPEAERMNYYHLFQKEVVYHGVLPNYTFWLNKLHIITIQKFIQECVRRQKRVNQAELIQYVMRKYV